MISILNILNLLSIFFSVFFQVLLIRNFGATFQTDAYYLTIGIIQFVSAFFLGLTTDLFIPIYNDVKIKDKEESLKFTGAVFLLILIVGSIFAFIVYLIAPLLVKIFATGFVDERITFSAKLIRILSITIVFSSLNGLLLSALNANLFMKTTYAAALITPALNNIALIFFAKAYGLEAIIVSIVIGAILNFIVLFSYHFKKLGWSFSKPYRNPKITYLLRMNTVIRFAHSINSLKAPLTTNILSYFPLGYITLFSYTDKILNILFRITNSPMLRILFVQASNLLSKNKLEEIKSILKSTLKSNFLLFVGVLVPSIILFKQIFSIIFVNKLSFAEIDIMYSLFLFLIPYYLALTLELPFTNITIAMKRGTKVAEVAVVSIILYTLFLLFSIKFLRVYGITISMSCAQIYNTISYTKFIESRLKLFDKDLIKTFVLYVAFGISLVFLNFFLKNDFLFQLYLNFLVLCIWFFLIGKDIAFVFRLVTQKSFIK